VLDQLVPALRGLGLRVEVQSGWVDDLVDLFNSATLYLYDSAPYWRSRGVTEGFGLPPIEALACGCVVFSSLNHALADNLDPGVMGHQLGAGTLEADLERIQAAVRHPSVWRPEPAALASLLQASGEGVLAERWSQALHHINGHWSQLAQGARPLVSPSLWSLRLQRSGRSIGSLAGRLLRLLRP
jgi:glycosyltransferase involved in cell wall biosynthesis